MPRRKLTGRSRLQMYPFIIMQTIVEVIGLEKLSASYLGSQFNYATAFSGKSFDKVFWRKLRFIKYLFCWLI